MATVGSPAAPQLPRRLPWLPFGDPSRGRRLVKVLAMARRNRCDRRGARAVRRRRRGLVLEFVGRPHRDRARVPRCRLVAADGADHADGAGLVLHPARGLPGRAGALPQRAGGLRHRRGAERLFAGQHRDVRDAADVRRDHPRLELRAHSQRSACAEDLLHRRRSIGLRLPVRVGARERTSASSSCRTITPS